MHLHTAAMLALTLRLSRAATIHTLKSHTSLTCVRAKGHQDYQRVRLLSGREQQGCMQRRLIPPAPP